MHKKLLHFAIVASTVLLTVTQSFGALTPAWKANLNGEINWQKVTSSGFLIVNSNKNLSAVNTEDGSILWENADFANIAEASFDEIPNSPFVTITKGSDISIIDPLNGKTLFNTKTAGYTSLSAKETLYKVGGFLVSGKKSGAKDNSATYIDLSTGKSLWTLDGIDKIVTINEISKSEIILVSLFTMYKIETATGNVVWKSATTPEVEQMNSMGKFGGLMKGLAQNMADKQGIDVYFRIHPDNSKFLIGSHTVSEDKSPSGAVIEKHSSSYHAYNVSDGKRLWGKEISFTGLIGEVIFTDKGVVILENNPNGSSKINLYNYSDAAGNWGKKQRGIKSKGGVLQAIKKGNSIFVVSGKKGDSYMNMLDIATGTFKWEKPVKTSGNITFMKDVPSGLLYIADNTINIIDLKDGAVKFDKGVTTNPGLYQFSGDILYTWSPKDNGIVSIDCAKGTKKQISNAKIKFGGKEAVTSLELINDGFLISSAQNIAFIKKDGSLGYHSFFEAPGESGLRKALLFAQAARAAMIATAASAHATTYGAVAVKSEDNSLGQTIGAVGAGAYANLAQEGTEFALESMKKAFARFKATAQSRDFVFILKEADKGNHLAQVKKSDGQIKEFIDLGKEKKPSYQVDDVESKIYYKTSETEISCYQFK